MTIMPNLHHFYAQVDSEWYESFDRYSPDDEFLRVVRPLLPTTWRIQRDGVWFGVHPPTSTPCQCLYRIDSQLSTLVERTRCLKMVRGHGRVYPATLRRCGRSLCV